LNLMSFRVATPLISDSAAANTPAALKSRSMA
jgi:hypothetical protein